MKHDIIMPDLGQTAAEGKVVRWLKKPGDPIVKGDPILEVETDKVTMEVESYRGGYLRALLVSEGQMASAMAPIAILTDEPEEAFEGSGAAPGGRETVPESKGVGSDTSGRLASTLPKPSSSSPNRVGYPQATPAARNRARELGIDWRQLTGSGLENMISRRDVENAWQERTAFESASPMAAITAKSAIEIPHFYVTVDAEVTAVVQWRTRWNEAHADLRASLNDVFVRAAAEALKDVPGVNVHYRDGKVTACTTADILLVAAVEAGLRLVRIPDPSRLSWEAHLRSMRNAVDDIRQNRMKNSAQRAAPALALSNLGMFGVKQFTAIIPPECAAVLTIGAVREEAIVKKRQLKMEDICTLTLAADHRVIDGIQAAKFLESLQRHLKDL